MNISLHFTLPCKMKYNDLLNYFSLHQCLNRGVIAKVEECSHPIVMKGLCAECGQDLTQ